VVLAQAKRAVAAGDRAAALALLRRLRTGPLARAQLTPALAEALVATARDRADATDRAAREAYARVQAARAAVVRLLQETPFDREDLAAIRGALVEAEARLRPVAPEPRDAKRDGGDGSARRLGAGWLDQKMVQGRWGPYLVYRYRVGKTQKMKYLGKLGVGTA
jgi:hypothetical protein